MFDASWIESEVTIYERVIGSEKDPKSKWLSRKLPGGRLYFTGRTLHALQCRDGEWWFGISKCNPTDAFDKVEGKRRARDRAFGAFQRHIYNSNNNEISVRGLKLITFHNHRDEVIEGWALGEI